MANLFFSVNFTIFFGIVIAPKEYPFIFRVEPGDERLELTAWKLDSVDKNPRWRIDDTSEVFTNPRALCEGEPTMYQR